MPSMSVSGIVSGMDWESMIDEIITAAAKPAQVQVAKKTNLQNKKSLFEEMKVMVQAIQSSMTSLKLPSTYKAKAVDIERVDKAGSYKGVLTATVNADAQVNVHDIVVQQLATAQTNRSNQITASTIASTLSGAGITGSSKMYINAGGQKIGIDVYSTDSLQSIKSRINNTVKTLTNDPGITASVVDNRLVIKSDNTGLGITTTEETFTYNINGVNTLSTINVDEGGTLTLRGSSGTYTQGEDFVVANGNQIRWKQYDRANEVAIGDSVNLNYTMTDGDVYEASGTYGRSEAKISGFSVVDSGTLGSRLKIKDSDGTVYTYGKDFTLDGDKVEWLTDTISGSHEPSSYTVSYTTTETASSSTTITRSSGNTDAFSDFADFETAYRKILDLKDTDSLPTVSITGPDGVLRTYLEPKDSSLFTMTDGTNTYEYGRDYVIRVDDTDSTSWVFDWATANTGDEAAKSVTAYTAEKGLSTYRRLTAPSSFTFSISKDITDPKTKTVNSTATNKNIASILKMDADEIDYSKVTVKSGGTEYEYNYHYKIDDDGNIYWPDVTPSKPSDTASFKVNLIDDDGHFVGDSSVMTLSTSDTFTFSSITGGGDYDGDNFTITDDDGNTYVYAVDFTIDDNDKIHWVADDVALHPTGSYTLTYEAAGSLSCSGTYSGDETQTVSFAGDNGDLTYSQITNGASHFTLTDSGGTEYTYGTDYKITKGDDNTIEITWLDDGEQPDSGSTFTLTYTPTHETITTTVERSASDSVNPAEGTTTAPTAATLKSGTTTITQGAKTFYEGDDYTIEADSSGNAVIKWITSSDGGADWYYPNAGTMYDINYTDSGGNTTTYTAYRSDHTTLNMRSLGMTTAKGSLSAQYGDDTLSYKFDVENDDGTTGNTVLESVHNFTIDRGYQYYNGEAGDAFTFNWLKPKLTTRDGMPAYGEEITAEYEHDANTFTLTDNGDGLINALGLNAEDNITEAHNAILTIDGNEVQRDSNYIGETWNNEIDALKGVTLELKGLGEVSMDIYHDAEKAVEAINTFKDSYNDLMTWMNTRMSESQLDEDTAATVDSDDFRMRWGLLHGNALLRQTKSQMRSLTSETYTYSFKQRTSAEEIYGTMANNGLRNDATLRLRVGSVYSDLTISPTNTLQDIVDMINDSTNPDMYNIYYDSDGQLRETPLLSATISDDKLVITGSDDADAITLSGTAAMNALKMNYTYKGLFQIGLATTSTDYGKSGELEFDESKFMEALEDNPDEVQEMMLMFANNMDSWVKSMLTSSASGATKGTLSRQIDDLDSQIKSIDEYLERYQERLDRQEESLRTKFNAAEQSISKLSQQASSIAAILNQLNGVNSGSSNSNSNS